MSEPEEKFALNYCPIGNNFEMKEFIEINDNSAKRTRWLTIIMILATVIIFIGFFNSCKTSWSTERINALKNFENIPENNYFSDADKPKILLDNYFGKNDFNDFKIFACRFDPNKFKPQSGSEADRYIFEYLNAKTKETLKIECPDAEIVFKPTEHFTDFVKGDLNRLLKEKFLYSQERFPGNGRKDETQRLLEAVTFTQNSAVKLNSSAVLNMKDGDLIRLNRLLLEETYPKDILKSSNLIPPPESLFAKELAQRFAYDENVQVIEMPFFDVPIDVNDLGFIGGIALIIILLLLRYNQAREIKNLEFSFRESFYHNSLCEFYHKLAMRQVLTLPKMEGEKVNRWLIPLAKGIFFLPILAIVFGVGYDYYSVFMYNVYEFWSVAYQLFLQLPIIIIVSYLSVRCYKRQLFIDLVWNNYYHIVRHKPGTFKAHLTSENVDEKSIELHKYHLKDNPEQRPFWQSKTASAIKAEFADCKEWQKQEKLAQNPNIEAETGQAETGQAETFETETVAPVTASDEPEVKDEKIIESSKRGRKRK